MTRAEAEQLIILECGPLLSIVGIDTAAPAGTIPQLGMILARTLLAMGYAVASPLGPTDDELAVLAGTQLYIFQRRAVYSTLLLVANSWTQVDTRSLDLEVKYGQLSDLLNKRLAAAKSELDDLINLGTTAVIGQIKAGVPVPRNPWDRAVRGIPVP